jgi:uncharacterized protein (TIGR02996 family)
MPARRELLELLRHAKEDPDDAPRRAVLADWLEENGDETDRERARVLRACLAPPEETRFSLYGSDPRFRTVVPPEWPPLKDRFKVVGCDRWGFLQVEATAKDFRERFENASQETREWMGTLALQHEGRGKLNRSPCSAGLVRLHLSGFQHTMWNIAPLLKDGLTLLREFVCTKGLSNRALESLKRAPFVPRLRFLSLQEKSRHQRETDRPLFRDAPFEQLRQFSCGPSLLGRFGPGPWTRNLKHIAFNHLDWEPDDWPLGKLGALPKLRRLDLSWEGPLERLIAEARLEDVPMLNTFSYAQSWGTTMSLVEFARWPLLRQLKHLQLSERSHDREEGLRLLLDLPLETLDLSYLELTPIQLDWLRRHAHDRVRLPETARDTTD